jgi:magnesium-transporting ATPase (P-type)
MAVSSVKDFFEDRVRQRSDQEENKRLIQVYELDGTLRTTQWRHIKVGDVIRIKKNEYLPVDLALLQTSQNNICYIETKNLDGETNLKQKKVPKNIQSLPLSEFASARMVCEAASDKIYTFQAVMNPKNRDSSLCNLDDNEGKTSRLRSKVVFDYSNFLLRGSSLRNTEFAVGITVYVGPDTRIMRNSV